METDEEILEGIMERRLEQFAEKIIDCITGIKFLLIEDSTAFPGDKNFIRLKRNRLEISIVPRKLPSEFLSVLRFFKKREISNKYLDRVVRYICEGNKKILVSPLANLMNLYDGRILLMYNPKFGILSGLPDEVSKFFLEIHKYIHSFEDLVIACFALYSVDVWPIEMIERLTKTKDLRKTLPENMIDRLVKLANSLKMLEESKPFLDEKALQKFLMEKMFISFSTAALKNEYFLLKLEWNYTYEDLLDKCGMLVFKCPFREFVQLIEKLEKKLPKIYSEVGALPYSGKLSCRDIKSLYVLVSIFKVFALCDEILSLLNKEYWEKHGHECYFTISRILDYIIENNEWDLLYSIVKLLSKIKRNISSSSEEKIKRIANFLFLQSARLLKKGVEPKRIITTWFLLGGVE